MSSDERCGIESISKNPLPPCYPATEISWAAEIVQTVYPDKEIPYTVVFPQCGGSQSEMLLVKQLLLHGYDFTEIMLMDRNIRLLPDL